MKRPRSVAHLQVLHVAAVSEHALEASALDLLAERAIDHDVAGTPRPFGRGDFSPHPRNAREGEAVSRARDVREH